MDKNGVVLIAGNHTAEVLREAVELHKEGLQRAREEMQSDRTIEEPEDLLKVMASADEDILSCDEVLEVLNDHCGE